MAAPDLSGHRWKDADEYAHGRRLGFVNDADHHRVEQARDRPLGLLQDPAVRRSVARLDTGRDMADPGPARRRGAGGAVEGGRLGFKTAQWPPAGRVCPARPRPAPGGPFPRISGRHVRVEIKGGRPGPRPGAGGPAGAGHARPPAAAPSALR
ncbi:hypothetical protein GCM10010440_73360 [Kitasatospora cinereorecta]